MGFRSLADGMQTAEPAAAMRLDVAARRLVGTFENRPDRGPVGRRGQAAEAVSGLPGSSAAAPVSWSWSPASPLASAR